MSASGTWNLSIKTPMGEQKPILTLTEEAGALSGSMVQDNETIVISAAKADGPKVSWKAGVKKPMPMTLTFEVTIDGETMIGSCRPAMFPPSPVTGTRVA